MTDKLIEIHSLTRVYRIGDIEVNALRGVDLEVRRGEFLAIMGSSGSGKSTLMNILGCLDRPTSGDYLLEGNDVTRYDEPALALIRSRRIGFVFQNFNLLSRTSAAENVALPLFYAGKTDRGLNRAGEALRSLGLEGREQNHPSQLSGGQQQRVAIARALVNNPAILLADEPTGNLDSATASDIMNTIKDLNREKGVTVLLVTHEEDMAAFADRIVTMRDGIIVSDSPNIQSQIPAKIDKTGAVSAPEKSRAAPVDSPEIFSFLLMALRVAVRSISRNKMRSALTMLGIFIGVAALITMVAVGQGANAAVKAQIESLGTNMLIILPGSTTSGGARRGFGSASTLTVADANAIKKDAPAIVNVSYSISQQGQVQYGDRNWMTSVEGVSPSYFTIRSWPIVSGRMMNRTDEFNGSRVCLIGETVSQNLFGTYGNPVGATILVKNVPMEVIGLLKPRGQTGFGRDQDDVVFIPFTTAERKVLGTAAPAETVSSGESSIYVTAPNPFGIQPRLTGYVNIIYVQARNTALVSSAMDQASRILDTRHRIESGQPEDFSVRNISDITQTREESSRTMALLLAAVASISLIVGGIGIMNILLVSVTERTREIGIRMAIGARRSHVLLQFLVEAVLLSGIGGVAGIFVGLVFTKAVSLVAGWPTLVSPAAIAGGFVFSAIVGVFFGYYPARRASLLNPIDALRYE